MMLNFVVASDPAAKACYLLAFGLVLVKAVADALPDG